ncbi:MAG: hypothetical protein ABR865_14215 [Terracidiphilus sp.]|jgi:uncharacterized membrane protein
MRWLLIVLLVSLGALLVAAAGAARHIWQQRAKPGSEHSAALEPAEEPDLKVKP